MGILDKRQPTFLQFREQFLTIIKEVTGCQVDAYLQWTEVGDISARDKVLQAVKRKIEEEYEFEPVIEEHLLEYDGPVESVANQVHHVISTMYIVEKINAKRRVSLQQ